MNRRQILRLIGLISICVAFITTLSFGLISHAAPGDNELIGFQGRLLNAEGGIVPNGYYNIQFKIYQGGSGNVAGNPDGTLKWTETYLNNGSAAGAVQVTNGFMSVNLGSINPFGNSIDWNQGTLWLSMNIAGAATNCTVFDTGSCNADGEMLPMKRLTASPYALNAGKLGGIDASGFIQNSSSPQAANLNITGVGTATTLQGNTSVIAPLFDRTDGGTLSIGTVKATTIDIGTGDRAQTINIGTGAQDKSIVIGSVYGTSRTTIQGGNQGVSVVTAGGFSVRDNTNNYNPFLIGNSGVVIVNLGSSSDFRINNNAAETIFQVDQSGTIQARYGSSLLVNGSASFTQGMTIQGSGSLRYTTPGGASLSTMINIPNYTVPAYGSIIAFGLPSTSAATARGILIADGRTGTHQATIGVLSPDENQIMGLSWNGSDSTGYLSNTANSLALQGNGLNLLTATNNSGQANVGIGNNGSAGYALNVTGDINSSTQYRIKGATTLTDTSLSFSGASVANVSSANGQLLNLDGKAGVKIQNNGTTVATFGSTNIQIGSGTGTGTPTLLTVDKGTAAPSVTGNAYLGSMYYDTTLGIIQCYEADGWGNCGASPDTFVSLSPEFSNAVINGIGLGTMKSDFCSDALDINDGSSSQPTVCGTNETYNFYNWTYNLATTQNKSIFVTYKLPSNFKQFAAGSTSLMGRTDSANANVSYQVYRNTSTGLTACGTATAVSTGTQTAWQKAAATGTADPSACSFAAGDSVVFKINVSASSNANAYVGNLDFVFSNK